MKCYWICSKTGLQINTYLSCNCLKKSSITSPVYSQTSHRHCHSSNTYTKEKYKDQRITIKKFPESKVCPYRTLCHCIDRTAPLWDCNQLFITTTTFTAAAQGTISKWVKTAVKEAGVGVKLYTPHTTYYASVSKHANQYKNIGELLRLEQWRHLSTFYRHYLHKPKYISTRKSPSKQETILTHPYEVYLQSARWLTSGFVMP